MYVIELSDGSICECKFLKELNDLIAEKLAEDINSIKNIYYKFEKEKHQLRIKINSMTIGSD